MVAQLIGEMSCKSLSRPLRVASLFCGCGGLDLGFTGAGFTHVLAVDSNELAVAAYNANFKHKAILGDVARIRTTP